jgi:hypothetical protein
MMEGQAYGQLNCFEQRVTVGKTLTNSYATADAQGGK